ncbi:MAG TPA: Rieske (2Fe-2S) protein [Trebonia sp.]
MTTESQQDTPDVPARPTHPGRRGVLAGAGLVGVAGVISACGFGGSSSSSSSAASGSGSQAGSGSSGSSGGSGGSGAANGALASTSEIPVGGGKVFSSQQIVVTQPEAGTFKGFSAICTHMQCTVDQVANGTIDCPCHGSQFSVKDGAVVAGPAPKPLPAANIKVSGSKITLG